MFWGLIIKPNQSHILNISKNKLLHISHASLVDQGHSEKVMIHLKNTKINCVLGILTKGKKEFLKLDYFIHAEQNYMIYFENGLKYLGITEVIQLQGDIEILTGEVV